MPARVAERRGAQVSRGLVAGDVPGGGFSHARLIEIQRARLLAAAVRAVDELGYADTTVAHITARARVSRRTFYEMFPDREACLAGVLEDVLGLIAADLAAAGLDDLAWRERVRMGLWTILAFLDREPALARVCVVQALRGGSQILERREAVLAQLAAVVDEGRLLDGARGAQCTPITAEGLVGAAFAIVYARLLKGERRPLTGLLGELMGMIVLPYQGAAAARREQARPAPDPSTRAARRGGGLAAEGVADPLGGVPMRLTYRTARVLEGIAEHPGASNREAGTYAGIPDPGQVSKLLARLERLGLLANGSGGDYGITEHVDALTQKSIMGNSITLWGEPANPSHNHERFSHQDGCMGGCATTAPRTPFLTLPTSCGTTPARFSVEADTWENAETSELSYLMRNGGDLPSGFTGCDKLQFAPSLTVAPDTSAADTPAGLTVNVRVPQEGLANGGELSMSNIKNTTVTLPKGVAINPGQAAGLEECLPGDVPGGDGLPLPGENGEEERFTGPPSCPNASKVGTVQIVSPLLKSDLEGDVYLLQSTPPNLKLLIAASGEGVNLKIVADVHLNESTGQLTTTLTETPEFPFTDFKLSFSGGAQAALTTPTQCGTYTTTSDFTPWSTPEVADALPESSFTVAAGTGGAACPPSPLPFTPTLTAGSTTDQAGGYTDFSLLLTRPDDQQRVSNLQFHVPEGLLGMISKVPLCGEPQAAKGECSEASQIGHTVVESGPGPYPLVVPQPGKPPAPIYLTGPYKGAPYGLAIVVPLEVGPFTLPTQIVRAKIEVNPLTTELTVTTDEFPQTIAGVPADLRTINAVIDRPGFMFNPTDCSPMAFSGTATGAEGASAPISSHFQMGSCRSLTFQPNFKVSTSAKTSRADGASLTAKILYPSGVLGANQASSQSNIARVKVELPKQLPSRLTTLQKACTAAVFEANPANCPAASVVGQARAVTPVLPVPLSGPAYFVSHGGEAFPSLIVVLQGYGTTVDLVGSTFISKAGITSSTFKALPDIPFNTAEVTLPEGPFSALAANGSLCKPVKTVTVKKKVTLKVHGKKKQVTRKVKQTEAASLVVPTEMVGQNGDVIHQSTPVSVAGCPKAHRTKAKKHARKTKVRNTNKRSRS